MKHPLPEAARRICGQNHGLRDPERWVATQLKRKRFRGQKIGRVWFMTDADIAAAEEALYNRPEHLPEPVEAIPTEPAATTIADGLTSRGRRRLRSAS